MTRRIRSTAAIALGLALPLVTACSGSDPGAGPGFSVEDGTGAATYEYTIPAGAGEALDSGTPLEILPGTLDATVGETIQIVNLDERGHNIGPWFVGATRRCARSSRRRAPSKVSAPCTPAASSS